MIRHFGYSLAAWFFIAAGLVSASSASISKSPDWLLGYWQGEGALFGQSARMELSVCPLAGQRGVTLNYRVASGKGSNKGKLLFAGHADYFPAADDSMQGRWIGSNGVDHDLKARISGQEMSTIWHNAAVETGQTSYRLVSGERLLVKDWVAQKDGSFRLFAEAEYRRTADCSATPH